MKKTKKRFAVLFSVVMLVICMAIPAFAAETSTQDGLTAVIQTDKETYATNEDIQINVTVTNNNSFEVKNVSIEGLLPDALTLKDGDLKSKTVDLQPGETLSISCVAVLEATTEPITDVPDTTSPIATEPATVETTEPESSTDPEGTTAKETTGEPATTPDTTDEPTTAEPTTIPATTIPTTETPATTEQTETTTDAGAILPVEPSTIEPTTIEPTSALTTQPDTPDNPNTGSGSTIVKALLIAVIAAAVVVTIVVITKKNNRKATKVISLVLCGAIVASSFATIGFIKVGAEENNTRSFTVNKTITVDGEETTISANIQYSKKVVETEEIEKELENIKKINGGILPEIIMDEEYNIPSFIYGKYSNDIVKTGQDAINSLNDVKYLFSIDNPTEEFECVDNYDILDTISFRLQQYYDGIKVEQGEIIVTTDLDGNIISINGAYIPLKFELPEVNISENQAVQIVSQNFESESNISGPNELVIYRDDSTQEFQYVYLIYGSGYKNNFYESGTYYVSAVTGEILNYNSSIILDTVSATGVDNNNAKRNFEVEKISDDLYYLADFSKYIAVYDAGNKQVSVKRVQKSDGSFTFEIWWENVWCSMDSWFTQAEVVQSKNNTWKDKDAVTLYANLYDTYNYYLGLGRQGFNDKNGEIFAVFNDNFDWDWTNAASFNDEKVDDITVLSFGKENPMSLDTVAHEYTHSVQQSIAWTKYQGETGAIMEAYADIMGEIVQNDSSWIHGDRNMQNPFVNNYPSYYHGAYWKDTSDYSYDNGGVHNNSTVLSHAAYLMYENGISMDELAQIFYKSMRDMTRYADFQKFREAVVKASLEINAENTDIVKAAFDKVGVFNNATGTISGTVKDKITNTPISGVKVYIEENGVQTRSCYTNENGGFKLELPVGHHLLHYSHENYEHAMNGFDIEKDATTVIMEPVYLTPKSGNVTGVVKDKVTGSPISDVTLEVIDNSAGDFTTVATTTTGENGGFSLNLPAGSYSVSFNHPDYVYQGISLTVEKDATTVVMEPVYLTPKNAENPGFAGGDGTIENPYQVSTPAQLNAVRNDLDAHYIQINDIDMSDWGNWEPIGTYQEPFQGTYNGGNNNILNLSISIKAQDTKTSSEETTAIGLFGYAPNSTLQNIHLNYCVADIELVSNYFGSIVGYGGKIYNCSSTGNLTANSYCAGGIAGYAKNITNCSYNGSAEFYSYADSNSQKPLYTQNKVSGYFGGICGICDNVQKSYNTAAINFQGRYETFSGGIAGYAESVSLSYNTGILNLYTTGRETDRPEAYLGGITGISRTIQNCFNKGNLYVKSYDYSGMVGGITGCGYMSYTSCYNVGMLTNGSPFRYTGGIVGLSFVALSGTKITYCYSNISQLAGSGNVKPNYSISNSAYLNSEQLKEKTSYVGFDFNNIWGIDEQINDGYPYFLN